MKFGVNKGNIIKGLINRYDTAFECIKIIWNILFANATQSELQYFNNYKNKVKLWNDNGVLDTIWVDYIIDTIEKFSTIDTFIADLIGIYWENSNSDFYHEVDVDMDVLFLMTFLYVVFDINYISFNNLSADVVSTTSNSNHDIYIEDAPIVKVYIKKGTEQKQAFAIPINTDLLIPTQRVGSTIYFSNVLQEHPNIYRKGGFNFSLDKFKVRMEKHASTSDQVWKNSKWSQYADIIKSGNNYPLRIDFNFNQISTSINMRLFALAIWVEPVLQAVYKYTMGLFSPEAMVGVNTTFENM